MSTDFTIELRDSYIHIQNAPDYEITPEGTEKMWMALAAACQKHNCLRALAEGRIASREMSMKKAFESGEYIAKTIPGLKFACCLEGYTADIVTDFFKLVATNRGAEVEFFSDRAEALRWLGVDEL
jgi:hypothetical protein